VAALDENILRAKLVQIFCSLQETHWLGRLAQACNY